MFRSRRNVTRSAWNRDCSIARAFVLAVEQDKVVSTSQKGRIESHSDDVWVQAIINESLSFSALARGRDWTLETKPLMISICIRPFRSFREKEVEKRVLDPPRPSPQWIMWEVSLFSLSRTPAARTNRPSLLLLETELCFSYYSPFSFPYTISLSHSLVLNWREEHRTSSHRQPFANTSHLSTYHHLHISRAIQQDSSNN